VSEHFGQVRPGLRPDPLLPALFDTFVYDDIVDWRLGFKRVHDVELIPIGQQPHQLKILSHIVRQRFAVLVLNRARLVSLHIRSVLSPDQGLEDVAANRNDIRHGVNVLSLLDQGPVNVSPVWRKHLDSIPISLFAVEFKHVSSSCLGDNRL